MEKLLRKKMFGKKGFTILELLVVVAIIAILAVIAVPQFLGAIDKSRVSAEIADCASVSKALVMYNFDNSKYPDAATGLTADDSSANWAGPYIDHFPATNKWGGAFSYKTLAAADVATGAFADTAVTGLKADQVVLEMDDVPVAQAARLDEAADSTASTTQGAIRVNGDTVFYVVK
jgi:type II secretion system protein G